MVAVHRDTELVRTIYKGRESKKQQRQQYEIVKIPGNMSNRFLQETTPRDFRLFVHCVGSKIVSSDSHRIVSFMIYQGGLSLSYIVVFNGLYKKQLDVCGTPVDGSRQCLFTSYV